MERQLDRVTLTGLRAHGYHGVLESERRDGQEFVVDVACELDVSTAGRTDDLSDTVDYAALATAVNSDIVGDPVQLIETLAERVAQTCLAHPPVVAVEVTVHKPTAPIPVPFDDVTVTVRRSASR